MKHHNEIYNLVKAFTDKLVWEPKKVKECGAEGQDDLSEVEWCGNANIRLVVPEDFALLCFSGRPLV